MKRKEKHSTLVELLITIAIIAILAGMLLPALHSARQKARSISCINNLKTCGLRMTVYANSCDDYFPAAFETVYWAFSLRRMDKGTDGLEYRFDGYKEYRCPYDIVDTTGDQTTAPRATYGMNWSIADSPAREKCVRISDLSRQAKTWRTGSASTTILLGDTLFVDAARKFQYFDFVWNSPIHLRHSNRVNTLMGDMSASSLGVNGLRNSIRPTGTHNVRMEDYNTLVSIY